MSRSLFALTLSIVLAACSTEDATSGSRLRQAGASAPSDADSGIEGTSDDASVGPPGVIDAGTTKDAGGTAQGPQQSGDATYYDAEGVGSCGVEFPSDYLVAAMNDEQYTKTDCGKCVAVTGPKGTVVVRILDLCPGCSSGDLDLSETAFTKIANKDDGRVKITWSFVVCPF